MKFITRVSQLTTKYVQGYGQTECCGCAIVSIPGDYAGGCIGGLVPNVTLKLESVPEMGYLAEHNQG